MSTLGISQEVRILGEAVNDLIARRGRGRGQSRSEPRSRPAAEDAVVRAAPKSAGEDPLAGLARAAAALVQGAAQADPSAAALAKAEAVELIRRAIARLRELA